MDTRAVAASPGIPLATAIDHLFITVPQTALPNGTVVPAFQIGQYLCSKGADGIAVVTKEGTPWTDINYAAARAACAAIGCALITELQALALAHNIAQQDVNWSGGKFGEGELARGLHKWNVESAQPGTYESADQDEERGFVLSTGDVVFDVAGNAYTWLFDDVQGDADGLIAKAFAADSPSISTPPFPACEKGIGWYPDADDDWAGHALVRGGCWYSRENAGVFRLNGGWPVDANDSVGFRCTKPIGR